MAQPDQRDDSILNALPDRKPRQNIQLISSDMIVFGICADKARSRLQHAIKTTGKPA